MKRLIARPTWRALLLATAFVATRSVDGQAVADTLFDPATRLELNRILVASRQQGLPTTPLVNRVLQGAARGVPAHRVVGVVRAYADSMREARRLLGDGASEGEIDAGAAALVAGIRRDDLTRVRHARPGAGTATTALVVLTDFVRRGATSADATDAVATLAAGRSDEALMSLQSAVARGNVSLTTEGLRAAVRKQVNSLPQPHRIPEPAGSSGLPQLTDPGASLSVGAADASGDVIPIIGASGSLPFLGGSSLWGLGVTGLPGDSVIAQGRAGLAKGWRFSRSTVLHGWLGMESRPVAYGAELASSDSGGLARFDDLKSGLDGARRATAPFAGVAIDRTVSSRVAVGLNLEVQRDELMSLTRGATDSGAFSPDSLGSGDRHWRSRERFFVRSGMSVAARSLLLRFEVVHRVRLASARDALPAPSTLATLRAEQRLTPSTSFFAEVSSREPSDVFGSVSPFEGRFRLGTRILARPSPPPAAEPRSERRRVVVSAERIASAESPGDSLLRFTVSAAHARSVQVQGDLTSWNPIVLVRVDAGVFQGQFAARGGVVRFRIRVDDGPWEVPDGTPVDFDEFGGKVGVIILE
jgi:hypothetical protein